MSHGYIFYHCQCNVLREQMFNFQRFGFVRLTYAWKCIACFVHGTGYGLKLLRNFCGSKTCLKFSVIHVCLSKYRVDGIVTRLGARQPKNRGSVRGKGKKFSLLRSLSYGCAHSLPTPQSPI